MVRIRNLEVKDEYYICEYQPEGEGEWGVVKLWKNLKKIEVVKYAERDRTDWNFYRGHIKAAIDNALKANKTEGWTMWY
jgi:hypothetical protein